MIFSVLPALNTFALTLYVRSRFKWGWRMSFLRAVLACGLYAVLGLEAISLMDAFTRISAITFWLLPLLILAYLLHRRSALLNKFQFPHFKVPADWLDTTLIACLVGILFLTAITAWFAPPNTYDSLTYHMSRVAHWAQEGGVVPYASGILRQNYMSPGAEMGILHLYVLGQGDRFANFIQWIAMFISLVGVSQLTHDLDGGRRAQLVAPLIVATLPMGIAQATSTMTDYVTAMWCLLAAVEIFHYAKKRGDSAQLLLAAGAAGLAILSKPTASVFLLPFALYAFLLLVRRQTIAGVVKYLLAAFAIVLLLNLGYLVRNYLVFDNFFGGGQQVRVFTNKIVNTRVILSNLLRNASLHAGTPWPWINDQLYSLLAKVHWKLDLGLTDPRTSIHPFFTIWDYPRNETRATNTIQAILIIIAILSAAINWKRHNRRVLLLGFWVVLGFILFSALFKFDLLGSRYHMPFFVLVAPFVAIILNPDRRRLFIVVISLILLVGAAPLIFRLNSRPLLPNDEGDSVLTTRRLDQYFVQAPQIDEPFIEITNRIEADGCDEVGILLGGDSPEYTLWVLLDNPRSGVVIRWIISADDPSGAYSPAEFEPCAVICESCGQEGVVFNSLPLVHDRNGFRLYLKP